MCEEKMDSKFVDIIKNENLISDYDLILLLFMHQDQKKSSKKNEESGIEKLLQVLKAAIKKSQKPEYVALLIFYIDDVIQNCGIPEDL